MEKEEKKVQESKHKGKENPEDLKTALDDCEGLKNEYLAGWQRARADFLNYKTEETERIQDFIKYANEDCVLKMLPILDNFEIARNHLPKDLQENEYLRGIFQIENQIQKFLKNLGLEEIKSLGEKFDSSFHEVVEELENENKESGIIIEEIQKGYAIGGRLLRAAKVKVSK